MRGRQGEAEDNLERERNIFRGGGRKEREEEVRRGTRNGWVETKGEKIRV